MKLKQEHSKARDIYSGCVGKDGEVSTTKQEEERRQPESNHSTFYPVHSFTYFISLILSDSSIILMCGSSKPREKEDSIKRQGSDCLSFVSHSQRNTQTHTHIDNQQHGRWLPHLTFMYRILERMYPQIYVSGCNHERNVHGQWSQRAV